MSFSAPEQFAHPYTPVASPESSETTATPEVVRRELNYETLTVEDVDYLLEVAKNMYEDVLSVYDAAVAAGRPTAEAEAQLDSCNEILVQLEELTEPMRFRDLEMTAEEFLSMIDSFEQLRDQTTSLIDRLDTPDEVVSANDSTHGQSNAQASSVPEVPEEWKQLDVDEALTDQHEEDLGTKKRMVAVESEITAAPGVTGTAPEYAPEMPNAREFSVEVATLQERGAALRADIEQVRTRERERFDRLNALAQAEFALRELGTAEERLSRIETRLTELDLATEKAAAIEQSLARCDRVLDEVEGNVKAIATALRIAYATLTESAPGHPEAPKGSTSAEQLPTESEVVDLVQRVQQNQFYTDEERMTVLSFSEMYYRGVAEERPSSVQLQNFENLHSYINELDAHPSVDVIAERTERIMERIAAGASANDPDLLETARAMREMYDRLRAAGADEDRLVQAYQNLESFAREREADWLTVCGMRVPAAGADGVFAARSFREGLMVARDQHPELIQHPEKTLKVDQMIRLLAHVPKEGLTEQQVEELRQLARVVDIPRRTVAQVYLDAPVSEVALLDDLSTTETDPMVVPGERRHRTLAVEGDSDQAEGAVGIQVNVDPPAPATAEFDSGAVAPIVVTDRDVDEPAAQAWVGSLEAHDPVNEVIEQPTVRSWEDRRLSGSFTMRYASKAQTELVKQGKLVRAVDQAVQAEIARIERKANREGWLQSVVNPQHQSAFTVMENMSLAQIDDLATNFTAANRQELRDLYGMRYDDLVHWLEERPEMEGALEAIGESVTPNTTLGELLTRSLIARELQGA